VIITPDNGYALVGETYSFGAGNNDVWLIKTDSMGDTLWTRTYGGSNADFGKSIKQTYDGGFIIAGGTESFGVGESDVYVIKTDSLGDTLWTKTYGGNSTDFGNDVIQTSDTGYLVVGTTESMGAGAKDGYFFKTNNNGNTIWALTFGATDDDEAKSAIEVSVGEYAILGYEKKIGGFGKDFYIYFVNFAGWFQFGPSYGSFGDEEGFLINKTRDGGIIMVGTTDSYDVSLTDVLIIKTDSIGLDFNGDTITISTPVAAYNDTSLIPFTSIKDLFPVQQNSIRIYPNPFANSTTINVSAIIDNYIVVNFILYDLLGQKVQIINNIKTSKFQLFRGDLSDGIYFYEIFINSNIGHNPINPILKGKIILTSD